MRRFVASLLLILTLLCCAIPAALAETDRSQVIRVGCVDIENFLSFDSDGNVTGYGADYLAEISKYTGWKYEFVSSTWTRALQMLKNDEIDLLLPAEKGSDRNGEFLFSDTRCCVDYAALICLESNTSLYFNDPQSYDGITVGMVTNNYLNSIFYTYIRENSISVTTNYYSTAHDLNAALARGDVDAVVYGNLTSDVDTNILMRTDFVPAYFITSKDNTALMDTLNTALALINESNPYFEAELYQNYYGSIGDRSLAYTREEADFIAKSADFSIIYEDNDKPLEYFNESTDQYEGLYPVIVSMLEEKSGLTLKAISPNGGEGWKRMKNGEGDILISAFDSPSLAEEYNVTFTEPYMTSTISLVSKRGKSIDLYSNLNVATLSSQVGVGAAALQSFPGWRLVYCSSIEECLKKVRSGAADAIIINSVVLRTQSYIDEMDDLVIVLSSVVELPVSLAISNNAPRELITILNKAIAMLDSTSLNAAMLNVTLNSSRALTLEMMIANNPLLFLLLAVVFTALIAFTLFQLRANRTRRRQFALLEGKNKELTEARIQSLELRKKADTDALTGILNRGAAEARCHNYLYENKGSSGALFVLDIDNFKRINDSYGHQKGDELLREFANALTSVCRQDDFAGRVGGDEFIVFLRNTSNLRVVSSRADEICALCEPIAQHIEGFSCSIGIAVCSGEPTDYDTLFARADEAMYDAKRHGKNGWRIWDPTKNYNPENHVCGK